MVLAVEDTYSDRRSNIVISGGGGGFYGGKTNVSGYLNEYSEGKPALIKIDKINFKGEWLNKIEQCL